MWARAVTPVHCVFLSKELEVPLETSHLLAPTKKIRACQEKKERGGRRVREILNAQCMPGKSCALYYSTLKITTNFTKIW